MEKLLTTHVFNFAPKENGGESLLLETEMFDNGDDEDNIYWNQHLTLHSYGNSACFNLCGITLTPKLLRELANQLEVAQNKILK